MRKILLIISLAFFAVCFMFPCVILPFGTYKGELDFGSQKVEYFIKFQINGKVKARKGEDGEWNESFYKLKDGKIIVSDDKTFNNEDLELTIINANQISYPLLGKMENSIGLMVGIAILVLDVLLVITIPKKK